MSYIILVTVSDVSVLNGTSLQCTSALNQSDIIQIQVNTLSKLHTIINRNWLCMHYCSYSHSSLSFLHLLLPPALPWRCRGLPPVVPLLHLSACCGEVLCVSDPWPLLLFQVSLNEDYSCYGLVLGTSYTFTLSAINCGDQEGIADTLTLFLEGSHEYAMEAWYHGYSLCSSSYSNPY